MNKYFVRDIERRKIIEIVINKLDQLTEGMGGV
jgi:hypothetical protein